MNRAHAVVAAVLFLLLGDLVTHAAAGMAFGASATKRIGTNTIPKIGCHALLGVFARDQWAELRNDPMDGGFAYDEAANILSQSVGELEIDSKPTSVVPVVWLFRPPMATRGGTEVVQRAMSRAELAATQETGLLRGGRAGTHFASDAVNSSAGRAQQRLGLPVRPEVRATLEVPAGRFSAPTRVQPFETPGGGVLPGGGMERTATGNIPARVLRVDGL